MTKADLSRVEYQLRTVRTATLHPRLTLGEARQGCRADTLAGLLPGAAGVVVSSTRHARLVEATVLPPSSTVIEPAKVSSRGGRG
jgi:hypothetical protein